MFGALPPFIEKIEDLDNIHIVRLKGPIDMATIPQVEKHVEWVHEKHGPIDKHLLLNFEKVDHVDSSTCAMLVSALSELKKSHHRLLLVSLSPRLKSMLYITKLRQLFSIYDSEEEAIGSIEDE